MEDDPWASPGTDCRWRAGRAVFPTSAGSGAPVCLTAIFLGSSSGTLFIRIALVVASFTTENAHEMDHGSGLRSRNFPRFHPGSGCQGLYQGCYRRRGRWPYGGTWQARRRSGLRRRPPRSKQERSEQRERAGYFEAEVRTLRRLGIRLRLTLSALKLAGQWFAFGPSSRYAAPSSPSRDDALSQVPPDSVGRRLRAVTCPTPRYPVYVDRMLCGAKLPLLVPTKSSIPPPLACGGRAIEDNLLYRRRSSMAALGKLHSPIDGGGEVESVRSGRGVGSFGS